MANAFAGGGEPPATAALTCFFVSDLHGGTDRYEKLFRRIREERPRGVFIGGDLLPSPFTPLTADNLNHKNFLADYLEIRLALLKESMGAEYPDIFVILGNDDGRTEEAKMREMESRGLWRYCHNRAIGWRGYSVSGYAFIPPTPFRLKDWERYDVSRYVEPGCIAPEDGLLTLPRSDYDLSHLTIAEELERLTAGLAMEKTIMLFHSPPYRSKLDRAALDGKMADYVPLDVHVGSIAIQRFIENRQPLVTLHGHIHESSRLTGSWRDRFKGTEAFNAAFDGPELSLIRFNPGAPRDAERLIL